MLKSMNSTNNYIQEIIQHIRIRSNVPVMHKQSQKTLKL